MADGGVRYPSDQFWEKGMGWGGLLLLCSMIRWLGRREKKLEEGSG